MIDIVDLLFDNPCIMAIKDNMDLKECIKDDYKNNKIVFVLYGNIENITNIVFVHEDLIEGLSSSSLSSSFIKKYTNADGIITTRSQNAAYARRIGLLSILRFFVLDSLSYKNVKETLKKANCDLVEILPGIMPKILDDIDKRTSIPIIAGGIIRDKKDVFDALNSKAIAVSSSNYNVWKM